MKIPLNWLAEYTKLPEKQDELVSKLRSQLGEVESVQAYSKKYDGIVLAEIVKKSAHPNADTLGVYQVRIDQSDTEVQVVAGDLTLEVGDKVAYFTPGAKIPFNPSPEKHGAIVEATTLRGIESNGMLASEKELDLGSDHSLVMRIESDKPIGTPISEVLSLDDTVIEIENKALTNRADCFGIVGIAREVSGITGHRFETPSWYKDPATLLEGIPTSKDEKLKLEVQNNAEALCSRYSAIVMKDITVKRSPDWLRASLIKCGVRPINNVVDISNYVMLLTGQPTHIFDYDAVIERDYNSSSAIITVRQAESGEKINTLDDKTHELSSNNLVICDSSHPIALAGIMGGKETEITSTSKNVIIESASFDMYNIRKSSMALGIFSEAVTRFSKGLDAELTIPALNYVVKLLHELADGTIVNKLIDVYPVQSTLVRNIKVNLSYLNERLGTEHNIDEVSKILGNVELKCAPYPEGVIVEIPSFRRDLVIEEDIHEEVGRLNDYDKIPITLPTRRIDPIKRNRMVDLKMRIRNRLVGLGLNEILTYNFVPLLEIERYSQNPENNYKLINPLSPELKFMRSSLASSVLEKARINLNQLNRSKIGFFEINKAHHKSILQDDGLPKELDLLVIGLMDKEWSMEVQGSPFYQLKSYFDALISSLGITNLYLESLSHIEKENLPVWLSDGIGKFDLNGSAVVVLALDGDDKYIGVVGEISPSTKDEAKLPDASLLLEIDIEQLLEWTHEKATYREPSKYPRTTYDLCFEVSEEIIYAKLHSSISDILKGQRYIYSIEPIDIYQSDPQKESKQKQITLRVELSSKDRTLENEEGKRVINQIVENVINQTGAELK